MVALDILKGVGLHRADALAIDLHVGDGIARIRGDGEGLVSSLADADAAGGRDRAIHTSGRLDGVVGVTAAGEGGIGGHVQFSAGERSESAFCCAVACHKAVCRAGRQAGELRAVLPGCTAVHAVLRPENYLQRHAARGLALDRGRGGCVRPGGDGELRSLTGGNVAAGRLADMERLAGGDSAAACDYGAGAKAAVRVHFIAVTHRDRLRGIVNEIALIGVGCGVGGVCGVTAVALGRGALVKTIRLIPGVEGVACGRSQAAEGCSTLPVCIVLAVFHSRFTGDGSERNAVCTYGINHRGAGGCLIGQLLRIRRNGAGADNSTVVGQRTLHCNCAVNGQGLARGNIQRFILGNGQVVRQCRIPIDLALVALKDDAAPIVLMALVANGACEDHRVAVVGLEGAGAAAGEVVSAAADARSTRTEGLAAGVAGGGDGAAGNGDFAAAAAVVSEAAADGRAVVAAGSGVAAGDGDLAAVAARAAAAVSAADGRAQSTLGLDNAAVDGDGAAAAAALTAAVALTAADARAVDAGCDDRTAVDGDLAAAAAAAVALAAADACAELAAGSDVAAVDGNGPAAAAVVSEAAADARTACVGGLDNAAVDGDGAAAAAVAVAFVASYDRIEVAFSTLGDQLAHGAFIRGLGVDGQGVGAAVGDIVVIVLHLNAAVNCESTAVCQDQVYITADGDTATDLNCALHHIPAGCPSGVAAGHFRGAVAGLRRAGFVQIGHAALRQRHRG